MKDGYQANITKTWNSQDEIFTRDNPKIITLRRSEISTRDNVYVHCNNYFINRSKDINFGIIAPGRGEIKWITTYGETLGLSNNSMILNDYDIGSGTILSGNHFSDSGVSDISLKLWVDGNYWGIYKIEYLQGIEENYLDEPSGIDETTKNRMLWIGIIILAGIGGLILRNDKENMGSLIFIGGCLFISFIAYSSFKWLSFSCLVIIMLGWIGRFLRGD